MRVFLLQLLLELKASIPWTGMHLKEFNLIHRIFFFPVTD